MHEIAELQRGGLREFGLVTGAIVIVLFGFGIPWIFELNFPSWPWVLGLSLILWGLLAPESLGPVYQLWMKLGLLLNRVTTPIILGILFFGVFLPVAIAIRLFGKDAMDRDILPEAKTYRITSQKSPKERMERPF
jgi:Kef-type K+ transport system membrane component KefB